MSEINKTILLCPGYWISWRHNMMIVENLFIQVGINSLIGEYIIEIII